MSDQPDLPPDEALRVFDKDLGTWDVEFEIRPGPGQRAITTKGTAINRLIAGRWLVTDHEATVYPGSDAVVVTAAEHTQAAERASARASRVGT